MCDIDGTQLKLRLSGMRVLLPFSKLQHVERWKFDCKRAFALRASSCGGRNRKIEDLVKGIWIEVRQNDHEADGARGWIWLDDDAIVGSGLKPAEGLRELFVVEVGVERLR